MSWPFFIINVATISAFIGIVFVEASVLFPYVGALLAGALILITFYRFGLFEIPGNEQRGNLLALAFLLIFGAAIGIDGLDRKLYQADRLWKVPAFWLAGLAWATLSLLWLYFTIKKDYSSWYLLFLIAALTVHGYVVCYWLNQALDGEPISTYTRKIVDRTADGRRGIYRVQLTGDDLQGKAYVIYVHRKIYEKTTVNQIVPLKVYAGSLGESWVHYEFLSRSRDVQMDFSP